MPQHAFVAADASDVSEPSTSSVSTLSASSALLCLQICGAALGLGPLRWCKTSHSA